MNQLFELLGYDADDESVRLARHMARGDRRLVDKLIEIRRRRQLTQKDLANLMGVSQSAVAKFENGPRDPRLSTIRRYALALGVEVNHSVRGEDCSDMDDTVRRSGAVIRQVEAYLSSTPHRARATWHPTPRSAHAPLWEHDAEVRPADRRRATSNR